MYKRGLDAGGSEVRCAKSASDIYTAPSPCMEIKADDPVKAHIIEDSTLDFQIKKSPCVSLIGRRFVKGAAMNQYSGDMLICDNQTVKVTQDVTYVNIFYALAVDCLRRGMNDVNYQIAVCIPAAEYFDDNNNRIEQMKNNLAGDVAIYFPLADRTIRFHIEHNQIAVAAEGVIAAMRYRTNRDFVLKNTVVIDVGYRSTDITVLLKFSPVGKGAASRPIGGINLEANIQSQLERDNIFTTTENIRKALTTIYVQNGTELTDITEYVAQAKDLDAPDYINKTVELAAEDDIVLDKADVEEAVRKHYITQGQTIVDITTYVHNAKELFADTVHRSVLDVINAKMLSIGDIANVMCVGRPFSGDTSDPYNLVSLLRRKFVGNINMFAVPDAGIVNVVELINGIGTDE